MKTKKTVKNADTVRRILRSLKPYRGRIALSLLTALVTVVLTLYAPILSGRAIDAIIAQGNVDFPSVIRILLVFCLTVAATGLVQWAMNRLNNAITYQTVRDLRCAAFEKLQQLPLTYMDSRPVGQIVSTLIADAEQFCDGLLMGFTQLFTGVLTIIGTLVFMFRIRAGVAAVVVLITPVSLFAASFIAKRTYRMFALQSSARAEQTALIDETVANEKMVQAFSQEKQMLRRFDQINQTLREHSLRAIFFSSITNPVTRFVNALVYAGVGIAGTLSVLSGAMSVGSLSVFLNYANQYTKPFNEISGVVTEMQNAIACAARLFALIDETPQTPEREDACVLADVKGAVDMQHVDFSYRTDTTLIQDLNLHVKPGMRVAIVGPTGCGKTTLINLLMRFYDVNGGKICVDGTDIRDITRQSLRANYGMVLQDTWLMTDTVANNIAIANPQASRAQIEAACRAVHADSFIRRLPQGYDTVISQDSGNLSQGQMQLLCIARVMLALPPMLILDEATSSIDTRTEIKIQRAFAKLMQGRTSFIVAHRLSTIADADVILVMEAGKIREQGTHAQLLKQDGLYARLYRSQFQVQRAAKLPAVR